MTSTTKTLLSDARSAWRHVMGRWAHRRDTDQVVLRTLDAVGVFVWPGFWSVERCAEARRRIDALVDRSDLKRQIDPVGCDYRVFGAERLDPELDLFNDPRLLSSARQLYNESDITGATLAARMRHVANNRGSGQGWHRDSPIVAQYKFILYASDVGPENGPFQYILGSARRREVWMSYARSLAKPAQYRFDSESPPELIEANAHRIRTVTAPQGTLIVADTRGLHRGRPMEAGERYALTNYYFPRSVPAHIAELINPAEGR